uniref:NlpC/P60 family protein n=2 Tax=Cohnella candidum TaxID=2674991 RepID=A0A3G3K5U0_9BACL|nr:C40 family peptidase [Cohnella candidum]AYQ75541.1 NlpC/P60 family protein [Cohnella candidum]
MNKSFAGFALGLSIALSGGLLMNAQPTYAAVAVSTNSIADKVIATGEQFMGVRYQFGAPGGRTDVFDCSSFTQYVFKQNGIYLPRSSRQQAAAGVAVSKDQLQPGDLIFSDTNRDGIINHVSIYIGGGQLLHTYRVGIGVTISNFAGSTWDRTFVTARRVINGGSVQAPGFTQAQPARSAPVQTPASPSKVWKHAYRTDSDNQQSEQ